MEEEGAYHGALRACDPRKEGAVAAGHQVAAASPQEQVVGEACRCWEEEAEVQRNLVGGWMSYFRVAGGEDRVSLAEHWVAAVLVWVLWGVTEEEDLRGTGSSDWVAACWVQEAGALRESLTWRRS